MRSHYKLFEIAKSIWVLQKPKPNMIVLGMFVIGPRTILNK